MLCVAAGGRAGDGREGGRKEEPVSVAFELFVCAVISVLSDGTFGGRRLSVGPHAAAWRSIQLRSQV